MSDLFTARNIGSTLRTRLREAGVQSLADIRERGPGRIFRELSRMHPDRHLPVCYYLYSLQAALENKDWRSLSEREKQDLRRSAGLERMDKRARLR
jgi:hypothetical protein